MTKGITVDMLPTAPPTEQVSPDVEQQPPSVDPALPVPEPSTEEPPELEDAERAERRRKVRLSLKIPVTLTWVDELGEAIEECTYTEDVSNFGCRVALQNSLPEGKTVVCQNNATRKVSKGTVAWSRQTGPATQAVAGLDLAELDPEFWGPEFLVALIEASALAPKPPPPPAVVEKQSEARRGLLYALMGSLLYFFLGGYSTWVIYFDVSSVVLTVLAPMIFLAGVLMAIHSSIQAWGQLAEEKAEENSD